MKLSGYEDSRKRLLRGDLDVGVTFVIPKLNVEPRLVLLDQVGFEDQGFPLRPHDDRLQGHDVPHHFSGLRRLARRPEIAPNSGSQRAGLPYVDDLAKGVFEQVDAGADGEVLELILKHEFYRHEFYRYEFYRYRRVRSLRVAAPGVGGAVHRHRDGRSP